jgi:Xaa-Pro aminopeptidase
VAPAHNAGEVLIPSQVCLAFLQSIISGAKWSDATQWIHAQRATKTEREVERLRIAQRVAGYGLKWFAGAVRPGQSEAELAAGVYRECLVRGMQLKSVQHINVYPQISSGPNAHRAWRPVVTTGSRRLREGEMALLELAVCVDGFWADVTRVKAVGQASSCQQDAFEAVRMAQQAALDMMRPGVSFSKPHETACNALRQHGFAEQIVHITGHGLGFRYHEPEPLLAPGAGGRLKTGHVCSVEPGLYDRSWGGIRLEDNIVVTSDGVENLTKAAKRI